LANSKKVIGTRSVFLQFLIFVLFSVRDTKAQIPLELLKCFDVFSKFYLGLHEGRKLMLNAGMGDIQIRVTLGKTRRAVTCSTFQGMIILLFNENSQITYEDLVAQTKITDSDMARHLVALYASKRDNRILLKSGDKKKMLPEDFFKVNHKWKPKLKHVKIGLMGATKQRDLNHIETQKKILEERKINIDATIVRIMKMRQTLPHKKLINEVIRSLATRFKPKPQLIKKQIESLIAREYLQRGENSPNVYTYLA